MELKQVTKNTYYIPGQTNLGLFVEDNQAILIDSGNDESAGRKIYRLLEKEKWVLTKIINTHSNADHIGGNAYLQKKTGCDILSTAIESVWINEPYLESLLLWGAFPFKSLRNKFLQAQPSMVTHIINAEGIIDNTLLQAFPLEGHFLQMIGVKTPDNVFFIADSLFSPDIITKYGLTVKTDIEKTFETYSFLAESSARFYVPSHAQPTENLNQLIRVNRDQTNLINEKIVGYCHKPLSREEIIARLVRDYQITLSSVQYVLLHITVSAHLSYLFDQQIVKPVFGKGRMLWENITEVHK
jgi:glyoxylase-like metal-dependent hydrolase (beta-lactamase superfamily II)